MMKYPKNEAVWVSYYTAENQLLFIITANRLRDCYYLYELREDKFTKLGRAKTPTELEVRFQVYERIR